MQTKIPPETQQNTTEENSSEIEYNEPMQRSRLRSNLRKQSQKTIIFTIIGIIFLSAIMLTVGQELLIRFSLLIGSVKESQEKETNTEEASTFIRPPFLEPATSATNSARIKISGTAEDGEKVKLYINEVFEADSEIKDGEFTFKNVDLKEGKNSITAKAFNEKNERSDESNELTILFRNKPPELEISSPADGQSFTGGDSNLSVTGKSDADVKVTVNGFWAIMNSNGSFSYDLPLKDGDNQIKVIAVDEAGNKTEKELLVKYSR